MATQRIGGAQPQFGTIDEAYGIFENVEVVTEVEETELMDGDSDVFAVDQHTRRVRSSGEFTFKTTAIINPAAVGSGTSIQVNASDSDINQLAFLRSFTLSKSKGDYRKGRFEGTDWPFLGT